MRTRPSPHAKLTPEQVLEIRRLARAGEASQSWIARTYGITDGLVSRIIRGRAWRWLKAPARAAVLLIVVAAVAGAASVHGYDDDGEHHATLLEMMNSCDLNVAAFLNPNMQPRTDCDYTLSNVVVFQKVHDGYLLSGDFETGGTEEGLLFLKTKAPLKRGMRFEGEKVHPIGIYQYQAVDGFAKEVWAFGVVIPAGAKEIVEDDR